MKSKQNYSNKFILNQIESKEFINNKFKSRPKFNVGDIITLKYYTSLLSKKKLTLTGICIGIRNAGIRTTFRIRSLYDNTHLEQIFPIYSPMISNISINETKKVRASKLYFLKFKKN